VVVDIDQHEAASIRRQPGGGDSALDLSWYLAVIHSQFWFLADYYLPAAPTAATEESEGNREPGMRRLA
jgi:hypothetical protein